VTRDRLDPTSANVPPEQDPDPFSLTLAILAAVFGGGGYLEARRQRKASGEAERKRFAGAWRNARGGLARLRRQVERFEQFVEESGFGDQPVHFGSVRLFLDPERKDRVRALQSEVLTTASYLTKYLDELSNHLGPEDEGSLGRVREQLEEVGAVPRTYGEAVAVARTAEEAYGALIRELGQRHDFGD
jgi:hypothetical protein